uniref:Uncharacterized protein n=1 Tax=Loa loa TaxID=7209 RepID=A0A1I7VG66_LOALO
MAISYQIQKNSNNHLIGSDSSHNHSGVSQSDNSLNQAFETVYNQTLNSTTVQRQRSGSTTVQQHKRQNLWNPSPTGKKSHLLPCMHQAAIEASRHPKQMVDKLVGNIQLCADSGDYRSSESCVWTRTPRSKFPTQHRCPRLSNSAHYITTDEKRIGYNPHYDGDAQGRKERQLGLMASSLRSGKAEINHTMPSFTNLLCDVGEKRTTTRSSSVRRSLSPKKKEVKSE